MGLENTTSLRRPFTMIIKEGKKITFVSSNETFYTSVGVSIFEKVKFLIAINKTAKQVREEEIRERSREAKSCAEEITKREGKKINFVSSNKTSILSAGTSMLEEIKFL